MKRTLAVLLLVVLGIAGMGISAQADIIYVKCHYEFDSVPNDNTRLPCIVLDNNMTTDTTGIVRAYSFIQPYGTDSAVGWIESDTPSLIMWRHDPGDDTFATVTEAIEYARKVLKYKGRINWK